MADGLIKVNTNRSKNAFLYREDLTQAYRLYTLALAGSPELGAMNRLKESKEMNNAARWRLAAAYVLAGQRETAKSMIANAKFYSEKYTENYYTYGSGERDDAMILEALTLMKENTKAFEALRKVAGYLSSESWLSTQTTAYCLIGVTSYVKTNPTGKIWRLV